MNLIVDAHCHIDYDSLLNRIDEIVQNAKKAGLYAIVANPVTSGHKQKRKLLIF